MYETIKRLYAKTKNKSVVEKALAEKAGSQKKRKMPFWQGRRK